MTSINHSRLENNLLLLAREQGIPHETLTPLNGKLVKKTSLEGVTWDTTTVVWDTIIRNKTTKESQFSSALEGIRKEYSVLLQEITKLERKITVAYNDPLYQKEGFSYKSLREGILKIAESYPLFFHWNYEKSIQETIQHLNGIFQKYINTQLCQPVDLYTLEKFDRKYAAITFEGITQQAIPIVLIQKLVENNPLDTKEKKLLNRWINDITQNTLLCPLVMHKMLMSVVESLIAFKEKKETIEASVQHIECSFYKMGCTIFNQTELHQTAFLESLITGKELLYTEEGTLNKITISHSIPLTGLNDTIFLFGTDNPNKVVLVPKNPGYFNIWKYLSTHYAIGVHPLKIIGDDHSKRFYVMEKPGSSLDNSTWHTVNNIISEDSGRKAKAVRELINWMAKQQQLPHTLSLKHLFFVENEKNTTVIIKTLLPLLPKNDWSLYEIEEFALLISQKNRVIFSYIMQDKSLQEHPRALFFKNTTKEALENGLFSEQDLERKAAVLRLAPIDIKAFDKVQKSLVHKKTVLINALKQDLLLQEQLPELEKAVILEILKIQKERKHLSIAFEEEESVMKTRIKENNRKLFEKNSSFSLFDLLFG